jgi:hypothetical protein
MTEVIIIDASREIGEELNKAVGADIIAIRAITREIFPRIMSWLAESESNYSPVHRRVDVATMYLVNARNIVMEYPDKIAQFRKETGAHGIAVFAPGPVVELGKGKRIFCAIGAPDVSDNAVGILRSLRIDAAVYLNDRITIIRDGAKSTIERTHVTV